MYICDSYICVSARRSIYVIRYGQILFDNLNMREDHVSKEEDATDASQKPCKKHQLGDGISDGSRSCQGEG